MDVREEYSIPEARVRSVTFAPLRPDLFKKYTAPVRNSATHNQRSPPDDCLQSGLQGPINRQTSCRTCLSGWQTCEMHSMRIGSPIPLFVKDRLANCAKLAGCICWYCCRPLLCPHDPMYATLVKAAKELWEEQQARPDRNHIQNYIMLSKIAAAVKSRTRCCQVAPDDTSGMPSHGCGAPQPLFKVEGLFVRAYNRQTKQQIPWSDFNPAVLYTIFQHMSRDAVILFGMDPDYARPEWQFLMSEIHVPASGMRPPLERNDGDGVFGVDADTQKLKMVARLAVELRRYFQVKPSFRGVPAEYLGAVQSLALNLGMPPGATRAAAAKRPRIKAKENKERIPLSTIMDDASAVQQAMAAGSRLMPPTPPPRQKEIRDDQVIHGELQLALAAIMSCNVTTHGARGGGGIGGTIGAGGAGAAAGPGSVSVTASGAQLSKTPSKPMRSITRSLGKTQRQKINGKGGKVRGNIFGKRTNHNARTVATPDPYLHPRQTGLPEKIARVNVDPQKVSLRNMRRLSRFVKNGPNRWPGAIKILRRRTGAIIWLSKRERSTLLLEIGDTVWVHILDNHQLLSNRQPTLWAKGTLGMRSKVHLGATVKKPDAICTAENLDFDGDEENEHFPQSVEERAELDTITNPEQNLTSQKDGKVLVKPIQDTLAHGYLLTQPGRVLEYSRACNMLMSIPGFPTKRLPPWTIRAYGKTYLTGADLLSAILPDEVSHLEGIAAEAKERIEAQTAAFATASQAKEASVEHYRSHLELIECNQSGFCVERGRILWGHLNAGRVYTLLLRAHRDGYPLLDEFTDTPGLDFIFAYSRLCNDVNSDIGCTFGLRDGENQSPEETSTLIERATKWMDERVERACRERSGVDEDDEYAISQITSDAMPYLQKILIQDMKQRASLHGERNGFRELSVDSNSRGSPSNIAQVSVALLQQFMLGRRFQGCPAPLVGMGPAVESGWVRDNFMTGLSAGSAYFHYAASRRDVCNTAALTPEVGYLERLANMAMEGERVDEAGNIVTGNGALIQRLWGDHGFESDKMEKVKLRTLLLSQRQLAERFRGVVASTAEETSVLEQELHALSECNYAVQRSMSRLTFGVGWFETSVPLPVNLPVVLLTVDKLEFQGDEDRSVGLADVTRVRNQLVGSLKRLARMQDGSFLYLAILDYFSSHSILVERRGWGTRRLHEAAARVERLIFKAMAVPGTMVGAISAHTTMEHAMQINFDSFHSAGQQSECRSIERAKEIVNVRSKLMTPIMSLHTRSGTREAAEALCRKLPMLTLMEVMRGPRIVECKTVDDLLGGPAFSLDEAHMISRYHSLFGQTIGDSAPHSMLPAILRFEINRDLCRKRRLTPQHVVQRLKSELQQLLQPYMHLFVPGASWENDGGKMAATSFPHQLWMSSAPGDKHWYIRLQMGVSFNEVIRELLAKHSPNLVNYEPKVAQAGTRLTIRALAEFFQIVLRRMQAARLCGIRGIRRAYVKETQSHSWNAETGAVDERTIYTVETSGSNLLRVLQMPEVNSRLAYSNDIIEMYEIFGKFAAQRCIEIELEKLFSRDKLNQMHIKLFAATMCSRGLPLPMNRFGVVKYGGSILARVALEVPMEVFTDGTYTKTLDPLAGVTERSFFAEPLPMGTELVKLAPPLPPLQPHDLRLQVSDLLHSLFADAALPIPLTAECNRRADVDQVVYGGLMETVPPQLVCSTMPVGYGSMRQPIHDTWKPLAPRPSVHEIKFAVSEALGLTPDVLIYWNRRSFQVSHCQLT